MIKKIKSKAIRVPARIPASEKNMVISSEALPRRTLDDAIGVAQVIRDTYSPICVADLSFNNPNAFYELGVRHALKLSTIQIIRKGGIIPFDVAQGRTIIIDTADPYTIMDRFEAARKELHEHFSSILKGTETPQDNPISLFLPGLKIGLPKETA